VIKGHGLKLTLRKRQDEFDYKRWWSCLK